MTPTRARTLMRTVHITLGLCLGAFVYLPTAWTDPLKAVLGLAIVPLVVVSGVAMWQQARLRRMLRGGRARTAERQPASARR